MRRPAALLTFLLLSCAAHAATTIIYGTWDETRQDIDKALLADAVRHRDPELAVQAPLLDPLTAARCSLDEIRAVFRELVAAERADLPAFLQDAAPQDVGA